MTDFPRANYGPNEQPRRCECGSQASHVVKTEPDGDTKYRTRRCDVCRATFPTTEKASVVV
jgi:hypothetical protein